MIKMCHNKFLILFLQMTGIPPRYNGIDFDRNVQQYRHVIILVNTRGASIESLYDGHVSQVFSLQVDAVKEYPYLLFDLSGMAPALFLGQLRNNYPLASIAVIKEYTTDIHQNVLSQIINHIDASPNPKIIRKGLTFHKTSDTNLIEDIINQYAIKKAPNHVPYL